jgi:MurNAc alpha-1-phosphate uridylyltransferase
MIFAAGLGSRLKPWTDHHPKALAVVNGKSLLQRNIEYLQKHHIKEVIVNVHHFADQIIDAVNNRITAGEVRSRSLMKPMKCSKRAVVLKKQPGILQTITDFVVMNADILTDMDLSAMIVQHQQQKALLNT